jgi:hypothetical protein
MTEADWLACTDPQVMLALLHGKASDRKLRLFAAARCRLFRPDWDDWWPTREAVEAAEQLSDGLAPAGPLARLHLPWRDFTRGLSYDTTDPTGGSTVLRPAHLGRLLVQVLSFPDAGSAAQGVLHDYLRSYFDGGWKDGPQERWAECQLLREVFGNPFRPVAIPPAWQTSPVVALAQAAYEERALPAGTLDLARLAVLADALEDAGCDQADLLSHLRGPGSHVRGCWVLDLLLGKT